MILEGPGEYRLICVAEDAEPWASVSSPALAELFVYRNDVSDPVEHVYVQGPTHTWWVSNPLFRPPLVAGETVRFVLKNVLALRLEYSGLKLNA